MNAKIECIPRLVRSRPITGRDTIMIEPRALELFASMLLTNYAETGLGLLSPAGATVILVS